MTNFKLEITEDKALLLANLQVQYLEQAVSNLIAYISMAGIYSGCAVPGEADHILSQLEELWYQVTDGV